jgi:hypothetical protein
MSLNFCSLGSQGRVERRSNDMGGELKGIRGKVDRIAANMIVRSGNGTVWTSYENDDRSFWRQLLRELIKEGYCSPLLRRHKRLLTEYVEELGQRGILDWARMATTPRQPIIQCTTAFLHFPEPPPLQRTAGEGTVRRPCRKNINQKRIGTAWTAARDQGARHQVGIKRRRFTLCPDKEIRNLRSISKPQDAR